MLKIEGLSVFYPDGTQAVQRIDLSVRKGESIALVGANGAGKTSFFLSLVGVLPCVGGEVRMEELRLDKSSIQTFREKIGVVFQNPDDQLFMPTIGEDVAFGLRNRGVQEKEATRQALLGMESLGIAHLWERTALKLSGGEKRMAALATVLVMNPALLLLDEPTAFLDPRARRKLIDVLRALPQAKIIATHDMTFALETCARAVFLKEGMIFADGPSRELLYDATMMERCGLEAVDVWKRSEER